MQLEAHTMQYLLNVGAQLENAGHGQRGELISQAASALNYSEHWVRERLKDLGFSKSRKPRCDRGQSSITSDQCMWISNLIMQASRDNGKQLMSIKQAVQIAAANGLIAADVSESTVSREMRRHRVHPEQISKPKPHAEVRSLYPNHVWQFDVSVCVLYYLPKSQGLKVMPRDEFYKNKLENVYRIKNDRVLRYLITDHYSSAFYVEYFNTPGENSETLVQFLLNAFALRENDPVHGVPFMLVWDAGTANQSHLVKEMLKNLQVKPHTHEVGSPRAKGQVERTHNLVECEFESRLSMHRIDTIEELNEKAQQWAQMYNGTTRHRRHGHTRYGMWQTIRPEQLRICPPRELCLSLLQRNAPVDRVVAGDLTISYAIAGVGSHRYSVRCIPDVCIGDKVKVTYNPYQAPNVTVIHENLDGEKIHYDIEPIELDAAGFKLSSPVYGENYDTVRDTPVDVMKKQMNRQAYGVDTDQEVKEARKARKPAFGGQIDPFADVKAAYLPNFMKRKGRELSLIRPTSAIEVKLSYVKAVPMIGDSIGIESGSDEFKQLSREFKRRFPDGMPEEQLLDFTEEMAQRFDTIEQPLVAVVGK